VTILPEIAEPEDGDSPPVLLPEQTEKGPLILTPASKDSKVEGMCAWIPVTSSSSRTIKDQIVGVKSMAWPGALSLTDGKTWFSTYIGWGLKRGQAPRVERPPALTCDSTPAQECDSLPPAPPPPEAEDEEA
jgi:hypothetical protein